MVTALRHGAFRKLAGLYTLNTLLEWFGSIALMVLVYGATKSPLIAAAMLLCKQVAPALFVPVLGARIDRLSVRSALLCTFGGHAAVVAALAAVGYGALLFPLAVVAGICSALARATLRTGVARVLEGADLRGGNAVLNLIMGVAAPVAPALAAVLVVAGGHMLALSATALGLTLLALASLTVSVAPVASLGFGPAGVSDEPVGMPGARPVALPLSWMLALGGVATCVSSISEPSLLAYSQDALDAGVAGYGALFTAWALGITVGSLLFTRMLAWSMLRVYALATVLIGLAYLVLGVAPSIELACAAAVVGGIGTGMDWVAIVTAVQEMAPRGHEGRVAARLESIATAGPGVGILLGGVVAEVSSPRIALLLPGVICFAVVIAVAAVSRLPLLAHRSVRHTYFSPSIPGGTS